MNKTATTEYSPTENGMELVKIWNIETHWSIKRLKN